MLEYWLAAVKVGISSVADTMFQLLPSAKVDAVPISRDHMVDDLRRVRWIFERRTRDQRISRHFRGQLSPMRFRRATGRGADREGGGPRPCPLTAIRVSSPKLLSLEDTLRKL
jgi:hypothetical protein